MYRESGRVALDAYWRAARFKSFRIYREVYERFFVQEAITIRRINIRTNRRVNKYFESEVTLLLVDESPVLVALESEVTLLFMLFIDDLFMIFF